MTTHTPLGYYDLLEAFAQPGCALCRLLEHDVDRFLDNLLYEYPTDPTTQNAFRASRGLCHEHSWQLTRYNSALAVAVLYNAALDELLNISEKTPPEKGRRGKSSPLADALEPTKPCPACVVRSDSEKRYLNVIGEYIAGDRLRDAFAKSDGLCLPHFREALSTSTPDSARTLTAIQREKWAALKGEVETFLHKMDAHYHQEIGTEATSWLRALARLAGEKHLGDG